jgi:hypothetical protein
LFVHFKTLTISVFNEAPLVESVIRDDKSHCCSLKNLPHIYLQGYAAGFPIVIPTTVSRLRSRQLLDHLLDGNYLDAAGTKALTAELLTYNSDLQLLGYVRFAFRWTAHGQVEGEPQALPFHLGCNLIGYS